MLLVYFGIVALLAVFQAGQSPHGQALFDKIPRNSGIDERIEEDAKLDVPGLLTKYRYSSESHSVETEDGYLLGIHRIPSGKIGQIGGPAKRHPVLLMHGLLCSSADWIIMKPENGLAYILADAGYDVWMGNARGNFYSRNHTTLNADTDAKFWKFSWNEIGYYDLPAIIDYVLEKTAETQLHYIGHSQGTTSFFVMGSNRPKYNAKIKSMQALAPVAYMSNLRSPLVKYLAPYADDIELLTSLIGVNELLPSNELMAIAGDRFCNDDTLFQLVCKNLLFLFCGPNLSLLNTTMLPVILAHTPAGASSRQFVHYAQEYLSAFFRQYDHGVLNLPNYGSLTPPNYKLKSVTAPVALHYADNDWLSEPVDVDQLFDELPNPMGKFRVNYDTFNHLDFLYAIDVKILLYDRVISLMRSVE